MKKWILVIGLFFLLTCLGADPVQSYEAGKVFEEHENWYSAIESYQESLRENPSYNIVYQSLAECFYALGEYEKALDQIIKAETYKKNAPELLDLHAFIFIGLGKLDEATALFSKVLVTWPNDISARFGMAEIDICSGKITAASGEYLDALKRNPENRKALLSLALISKETGNISAARDYINKALQYHGDNPQVFYYAAYIASTEGLSGEAENRIRSALALRSDYDDAQELLATILYKTGRYSEVIDICDTRIANNRNHESAWYLRTLALEKLHRYEEALKSAQTGLQVNAEDEILRALMESIIINQLALEDSRRANWSLWHVSRAKQFMQNNMSEQALYEYRRVLKINPYDVESRQSYAKLLLNRGYPERYVEQLSFVQSIGKSTNAINDAIESYGRLLSTSIYKKWQIDPLYLDKAHTSIGFYYQMDPTNILHPDSERITTNMISEVFSYDLRYSVHSREIPVGSYSEAFRTSREAGEDYFALVNFRENNRDLQIVVDLYVSKTGSKADTFTVFRTGNDRFSNALRRLVQTIASVMPVRGVVLKRYQGEAVIDLGKSDGIKADMAFDILPKEAVNIKNEGIGLLYDTAEVLGTFTVSGIDEDISLGKLVRSGFFDRINNGDVIIPKPVKADTASISPAKGTAQTQNNATGAQNVSTVANSAIVKQAPALLSLLRKIR